MQEILRSIEQEQLRNDIPEFSTGDTVKVHVRITEGKKERIQTFEGTVLKRQGGGIRETFTVRRVAYGTGTERTFPVHTPMIDRIEVVRYGRVRRAKLFYLRERVGKSAKVRERIVSRK